MKFEEWYKTQFDSSMVDNDMLFAACEAWQASEKQTIEKVLKIINKWHIDENMLEEIKSLELKNERKI